MKAGKAITDALSKLLTHGLAAGILLLFAHAAQAAEPIPGEELLPENSVFVILAPDLQLARAQFEKTRLAEMFSQPLMQEFLQPVLAEIKKQEAETLRANPNAFAFSAALFNGSLAYAVFATPGDLQSAGIVAVFTPKSAEDFLAALPPALAKTMREGKLGQDLPPANAALAWVKDRLIFCVPREQLNTFVARLAGGANAPKASLAQTAGYAKAKERLSGSAVWLYAAPQAFFTLATSEIKDPGQLGPIRALWAALGLDKLDAAGLGLGFKNGEPVAEGFAGLSAPNSAILSLCFPVEATPLPAEAFRIAAPDAPYVAAGYADLAGLLPLLKRNLGADHRRAAAILEASVQAAGVFLNCDLQKDLLENLDGHFVVAQTSTNTALPILFLPGLVCSFAAKNPAKFEECLGAAATQLAALPGPLQGTLKLKKVFHAEKAIYYLSGPFIPLSPAVCLAEGRLLIGTSLNAVRRTLEQLQKKENKSILDNQEFQQALARVTGQPFSPDKIPPLFAYGVDQGSGNGALLLAAAYLAAASGLQIANAALPGPPREDMAGNESHAFWSCAAYAEAQEIYHRTDYTHNGVLKYAQALQGDNSLFETKAGLGDLAIISKEFAQSEGNPDGKTACHGYRFKILTSIVTQVGEKKSYIVNGNMTLGYALLAYPVQYGTSGKRSFIINNNGVVYAIDWGQQTAEKAAAYSAFDTKGWEEVGDMPKPGDGGAPPGRVEAAGLALLRQVDLGFWPDQAFFAPYRKPAAALVRTDATGIHWQTEMPPPLPASPIVGSGPVLATVAVVAIGAGLTMPVIARARDSARRVASASNLSQIAKGAFIYSTANGNKFPAHPAELFPQYIANPQVFKNPRFPNEDVGYTWVSGMTADADMSNYLLAFENPPPGQQFAGRNVVLGQGTVEWREEASFQEALEATRQALKKANREMKLIPMSFREITERGNAGQGAPAPAAQPPPGKQPEF
ncbi:MAG: DUF2950 family protein [Planctomycetota bacterium]